MAIQSEDVPEARRPLLRLVERWGLGDDFEGELAVRGASDDELADLVEVIEGIADELAVATSDDCSTARIRTRERGS